MQYVNQNVQIQNLPLSVWPWMSLLAYSESASQKVKLMVIIFKNHEESEILLYSQDKI